MRAISSIFIVGITVAGLAGATSALKPEWKATIKPEAGSNIVGTAEVEEKGSKASEVEINIKGATAGSELPWHLHSGKCSSPGAIVGPATAYKPLKVDKDGSAKGEAKIDVATPTAGDYSVNVHKSAADEKTIVACGDLALEKDGSKSGY